MHVSKVSKDVLVLLVVTEGIEVSLLGFIVLAVVLVNESVDVPAGEVSEVLEESLLDELVGLGLFLLSVEAKSLERDGFCGKHAKTYQGGLGGTPRFRRRISWPSYVVPCRKIPGG